MELLLRTEVPEAFRSPAPAQLQQLARQLHCRPKDIEWNLVLLAPQCTLAEQYFAWFHGLPEFIKAWAVPPMIMSRTEYAARTNHSKDEDGIIASALEFGRGFRELHRPPHYGVVADAPPRTDRVNE